MKTSVRKPTQPRLYSFQKSLVVFLILFPVSHVFLKGETGDLALLILINKKLLAEEVSYYLCFKILQKEKLGQNRIVHAYQMLEYSVLINLSKYLIESHRQKFSSQIECRRVD